MSQVVLVDLALSGLRRLGYRHCNLHGIPILIHFIDFTIISNDLRVRQDVSVLKILPALDVSTDIRGPRGFIKWRS